mgnify:CR=1 FL=1
MAKNELRGASRRQFIQSVTAMGAMLGWGPARIKDFIARGAGEAAAANSASQNLVVLHGKQGAHGYPHLLFPHPDSYPNRTSNQLCTAFMQTATNTGATGDNLGGALSGTINYVNPPAMPSRGQLGAWNAGDRYKQVFGADNQAFAGFKSSNPTSQSLDQNYWGNSTIPKNAALPKAKKFLVAGRETPWLDKYGISKGITALDGGIINTFHITGAHNHYINFSRAWSMMAAAASIQQATRPTIVPVITISASSLQDPQSAIPNSDMYGIQGVNLIPGAPSNARVGSASQLVGLFNSNCARALGALANPANAQLFEAYTKGWIGSSKSAQLPTFSRGYRTAKLASNLVGLNLSDKLLPTAADQARYGYTGNTIGKLADLRDSLIVTAKALALGLTSQVIIAYGDDDPHSLFTAAGAGVNASTFATAFSNFLNAFMDDLMQTQDLFTPNLRLGDNTCIAFVGDVPRTGVSTPNWNDPTFGGQNRCWIMSNGILKTGFFGGDRARMPGDSPTDNNQNSAGPGEGCIYDPVTGDAVPITGVGTAQGISGDFRVRYGEMSMAAVLYAVARGDDRRVQDFYSGVLPTCAFIPQIL